MTDKLVQIVTTEALEAGELSAGDLLLIRKVVDEFVIDWTDATGEEPVVNFQTMLLLELRLNEYGIELPAIRNRREKDTPLLLEYMERRKRLKRRGVEFI